MSTVTIYSTPTCPWCHKAKQYLSEKEIPFTEVNVAEDQAMAEEMVRKSGQMAVPMIDIDGKIIVGFDKEKIDKLLSQWKLVTIRFYPLQLWMKSSLTSKPRTPLRM